MRYRFLMATCYRCHRLFGSNPSLVPSVRDPKTGEKEPLCLACVREMQSLQRAQNVEVWADPMPGAYEPEDLYADGEYQSEYDYDQA